MTNEIDKRIGLHLTDAEIVDLLGKQAAASAIEIVNKRVHNLMTFGFAAIGLLAGVALLFIDQRIDTKLVEKVPSFVGEEVESSVILPLVAAEINSLASATGYTSDDAESVLEILKELAPDISDMSDTGYWLATRRLEEVVDLFWGAGDYGRVFEVDLIFEHDLMEHDGIYFSFTEAMASGIVIHQDFPREHQASFDEIMARNVDHRQPMYEKQRLVRVLHRASEAGWTKDALMIEFRTELTRDPYFHTVLINLIQGLKNELAEGGLNHTGVSEQRYEVLVSAAEDY